MVSILLYGYIIGVRSSRVIERKCVDDVCFRWLAAGAARTIERSPDSAGGTWLRWGSCLFRRWRCARPRASSG